MPNKDWDEDDAIDGAEDSAEDEGDGNQSDYAVVRDADEAIGGGSRPSRVAVKPDEEEADWDEEAESDGDTRASAENENDGGLLGVVGSLLGGLFGGNDKAAEEEEETEEEEEESDEEVAEDEESEEEEEETEEEEEEEESEDEEASDDEEEEEESEEEEEEEEWNTYTVRAGDTLSKIAKRELGDASRWPEIFEANSETLDDPNHIEVGQELWIPVE